MVARDPDVFSSAGGLARSRLRDMLRRGLSALAGGGPADDLLASLYRSEDRVGLKVNCVAGISLSTRVELTEVVAGELSRIGVSREHMLIWDRDNLDLRRGGYALRFSGEGPLCFGNDARGVGYEDEPVMQGSIGSCLSRIVTRWASALINLPILKDHGLAGLSGALKNYYGAIHNPNKYHDNSCSPYVADVNALTPISRKSRLVICDALEPQCHGGPGFRARWRWAYAGLVMATDPVAMDAVLWEIVERRRRKEGLPTLAEEGREPIYLAEAAAPERALGTADREIIERIDV